ncbi:hypothetical protein HELRODRAFT_110065 [Helobdella robusta]|uniref:Peptidase metallopeptidase domain-containing protein n=1 Tax=Helobdella robusta TaxID=6412 RepID=T1EEZ0_HELRO|nr:hypothetical protein HELRODRAFT_110065 [Helobdella robusta]ESO08440.1 hypothetical protein HELRODRAFT_110065 [Helobdella robusta]
MKPWMAAYLISIATACCIFFLVGGLPAGKRFTKKDAYRYFKKFGYMKMSDDENSNVTFRRSVEKVQKFAGANQTGDLNDETINLLMTPRCQNPDVFEKKNRTKRFLLAEPWPSTNLTYKLANYPNKTINLTNSGIDKIIRNSLATWAIYAPKLSFSLISSTSSRKAVINLKFARLDHGDGSSFDGPGGVLAHAFYPTDGEVHFDADESWSTATNSGANFDWVAIHEIGHALGLDHSSVKGSIMYPYYTGFKANLTLSLDDIAGIQELYPV